VTEPRSRLWGLLPLPPRPKTLYEWFSLACFLAMLFRFVAPITVAAHP